MDTLIDAATLPKSRARNDDSPPVPNNPLAVQRALLIDYMSNAGNSVYLALPGKLRLA